MYKLCIQNLGMVRILDSLPVEAEVGNFHSSFYQGSHMAQVISPYIALKESQYLDNHIFHVHKLVFFIIVNSFLASESLILVN